MSHWQIPACVVLVDTDSELGFQTSDISAIHTKVHENTIKISCSFYETSDALGCLVTLQPVINQSDGKLLVLKQHRSSNTGVDVHDLEDGWYRIAVIPIKSNGIINSTVEHVENVLITTVPNQTQGIINSAVHANNYRC